MSRARDLADLGDGIAVADLPSDVVTTASPSLGRRNLIINGAMQVAQRGTSFSATGGSFQYGWVDRWKTSYEVNATYSQVDADVDGYGGKATRIAPTGANTQYAFQVIENPRSIASKKFTVSWWAKASGTFAQYIYVRRGGGGDLYFDPSFTNVTTGWQRFSVTVTGFEATALADGANLDILIGFTSTGSSDTYDLTMVQVEEGTVATPFEHRSFGEELALCQRYFHRSTRGTIIGAYIDSNRIDATIHFPVTMRATPAMTASSGTNYWYAYTGGTPDYFNSWSGAGGASVNNGSMYVSSGEISGPDNAGCQISFSTDDSYFQADAEL